MYNSKILEYLNKILKEEMDSLNWQNQEHYEDNPNYLRIEDLVEAIMDSDYEEAINEVNELEDWLRKWTSFKEDYSVLDRPHFVYVGKFLLNIIIKYNIKLL